MNTSILLMVVVIITNIFPTLDATFVYRKKIKIHDSDVILYGSDSPQDAKDPIEDICLQEMNECLSRDEITQCFYIKEAMVAETYWRVEEGHNHVCYEDYTIPFKPNFLAKIQKITSEYLFLSTEACCFYLWFDVLFPEFIKTVLFFSSDKSCELLQEIINEAQFRMPKYQEFVLREIENFLNDLKSCNKFLEQIDKIEHKAWHVAVKDIYNIDLCVILLLTALFRCISEESRHNFIIAPVPIVDRIYTLLTKAPGFIDLESYVDPGLENRLEESKQEYKANRQKFYELQEIDQLMNIACDFE